MKTNVVHGQVGHVTGDAGCVGAENKFFKPVFLNRWSPATFLSIHHNSLQLYALNARFLRQYELKFKTINLVKLIENLENIF